jgi:hypothetical protein
MQAMMDERKFEKKIKGILALKKDDESQIQPFSVTLGTKTEFYDTEFLDWVHVLKEREETKYLRSIKSADLGLSGPSSEVSNQPLNLRRDDIVKAFKKQHQERAKRRNVFYRKIMERMKDDEDMDIVEWPIEEEEEKTEIEGPKSPSILSIFDEDEIVEAGMSLKAYDSDSPHWIPDPNLPVQYTPSGHLLVNDTSRPLDADFERAREFWRTTVLLESSEAAKRLPLPVGDNFGLKEKAAEAY